MLLSSHRECLSSVPYRSVGLPIQGEAWLAPPGCKEPVCSTNTSQPCLDPPPQIKMSRKGNYRLLNGVTRWRSCLAVPRGFRVNRIRLWPLRRDDHSGVLSGADGTWRSEWPARVLATDVSTRIDREPAREEQSIACVQRALSCYLDVIYLLSSQGMKKGARNLWYSE